MDLDKELLGVDIKENYIRQLDAALYCKSLFNFWLYFY